MKRHLAICILATFILGSCNNSGKQNMDNSQQSFNLDTTGLKAGDEYFQCDMDPEIISDKAGDCPKCGMALTVHTKL